MFWIISLLTVLIGSSAQASNRVGLQQSQPNAWSYLQQQSQLRQDDDNDVFYDALEMQAADTDDFYDTYEFGLCPVCYEDKVLDVVLNCGHNFCTSCMKGSNDPATGAHTNGWLDDHSTCPMCRANVTTINGQAVTVPFGNCNPRDYVFRFDRPFDRQIVAPQYRQQMRDFIYKLTPAEFAQLLQEHENDNDIWTIESQLAMFPEYTDSNFGDFSDDERIALYLDSYDLAIRSDYQGRSVGDLVKRLFETDLQEEREKRTEERRIANEAAFYERYPEARAVEHGQFQGDLSLTNDDNDMADGSPDSDSDSSDSDDEDDNND